MDALARTVVNIAGFFELCEDDVVDPDVAVDSLQAISSWLHEASPAELEAVRAAATDRAAREEGEAREFFANFMELMGLEDLPEDEDDEEEEEEE